MSSWDLIIFYSVSHHYYLPLNIMNVLLTNNIINGFSEILWGKISLYA